MDGSLRTRKDSTAVGNRDGETKRTGLKQPELFEASGLLLPLLFGPVLSCTPPRSSHSAPHASLEQGGNAETEGQRGNAIVCNHLFSF